MATPKQIEANRRNARKSTGPTSDAGKATVARNAVKHGVLALVAVPQIEHEADWEAHRAGIVAGLYPDGHVERELAERVALLLWRLRRVVRAEREAIALGQETVSAAVAEQRRFRHPGSPHPDDAAAVAKDARAAFSLLERLPGLPDAHRLSGERAWSILAAVSHAVENPDFDLEEFDPPGLPPGTAIEEFGAWTAGGVRRCVAAVAELDRRSADDLLAAATEAARRRAATAAHEAGEIATAVDRLRRGRLLPDDAALNRICRYEAALERSLYRALHALERLQAARAGLPVTPPVVVDVDVSVNGEGQEPLQIGFVS